MNDDKCVICGNYVPEGRQVCPNCEKEKGEIEMENIEQIKSELAKAKAETEKYKAVAFYLARLHRVKPEGLKLKKTEREIDNMSLSTIEHMANNLDGKVLKSYQRAAYKVFN